jgi:hypothetical protein
MKKKGGCEWYQSIDLYLLYVHFRKYFTFFLKDPGPLKALTDHLGGGSRVYSFDPYWLTGGSAIFFISF